MTNLHEFKSKSIFFIWLPVGFQMVREMAVSKGWLEFQPPGEYRREAGYDAVW
jgi:hypothetical protein